MLCITHKTAEEFKTSDYLHLLLDLQIEVSLVPAITLDHVLPRYRQESLSQFSSLVQLNTLNLASRFYLVKCNECKEPVIFQQSYNLSCSVFDIFSKELHLNLLWNLFSTPPFLCASFYTDLQVQIKPSSAVICSPTPPLHT